MKTPTPGSCFMPKGPVVEQMCARCPFKPGGTGFAVDHPEFPQILQHVMRGMPFYCHETVIFDERTTFDNGLPSGGGNPNASPYPAIQPHFENCLGAVMTKQGKLPVPMLRTPGGRPGRVTRPTKGRRKLPTARGRGKVVPRGDERNEDQGVRVEGGGTKRRT